jgi:excisionase family DNA binding protein
MKTLLLSAKDAAELLGIGKTLFYSMNSSGRLGPLPVRLGKRSLWRQNELEEWVRAGCPHRNIWKQRSKNCNNNGL